MATLTVEQRTEVRLRHAGLAQTSTTKRSWPLSAGSFSFTEPYLGSPVRGPTTLTQHHRLSPYDRLPCQNLSTLRSDPVRGTLPFPPDATLSCMILTMVNKGARLQQSILSMQVISACSLERA